EDALRDVRKQVARNREAFGTPPEALPVFGTIAARFNDDGVTALYQHLRDELAGRGLPVSEGRLAPVPHRASTKVSSIVPPSRSRYLAEIAEAVRAHHRRTEAQAEAVRRVQHLRTARAVLSEVHGARAEHDGRRSSSAVAELTAAIEASEAQVDPESRALLEEWPAVVEAYTGDVHPSGAALWRESLSGTRVPRIALPRTTDDGDLLRWLR